ncbi:helix-turn-helix domain-containing protein [Paenibacillus sabinae]|uniref:HTH cro/C1-type domain-containing protein n=1 Tax=Paenibacillus sabinae T27 TaxID=1268072 RepID=X4ZI74_9BACL|nr:helix-turn-helix transcriptional regulator [Paenibacillus sabinae]AHV97072.1 hypothetical protein PSAB_10710 [Paenibacillus sabinae T27]
MDLSDVVKYGDFGFRRDYVHNPDDIMSIYNARRSVFINVDNLALHKQIKAKRIIEGFDQEGLGKIVGLPASTISLIETGKLLIPVKSRKAFERYLYDSWYVDCQLYFQYSEDDPDDNYEAEELMDIEEQRAYWKAIFSNDSDMWGSVL